MSRYVCPKENPGRLRNHPNGSPYWELVKDFHREDPVGKLKDNLGGFIPGKTKCRKKIAEGVPAVRVPADAHKVGKSGITTIEGEFPPLLGTALHGDGVAQRTIVGIRSKWFRKRFLTLGSEPEVSRENTRFP
jgi:hypothetical protein